MYGFCTLTDKCSFNQFEFPQGLFPIINQEELDQAELALEKGAETYEDPDDSSTEIPEPTVTTTKGEENWLPVTDVIVFKIINLL